MNETIFDEMIKMVMRQIDLPYDVIKDKLLKNNYDYLKVIKEGYGIDEKEKSSSKSINQTIYKEIRNLMDNGSKNHISIKNEREKNSNNLQVIEE